MSLASLPHPNSIIQSLFSHLSSLPLASPGQPADHEQQHDPTLAKPYLLTLHALFPTLLLPALDLLDRRLITRFELSDSREANSDTSIPIADTTTTTTTTNTYSSNGPHSLYPQATSTENGNDDEADLAERKTRAEAEKRQEGKVISVAPVSPPEEASEHTNHPIPPLSPHPLPTQPIYYVRSSQSVSTGYSHPRSRHRHYHHHYHGLAGEKSYEVRTRAWNCSCAAFAFGAFGSGSGVGVGGEGEGEDCWYLEEEDDDEDEDEDEDEGNGDGDGRDGRDVGRATWGGLMALYHTAHGRGMKGNEPPVPLCKHLLACVLAEWWPEAGEMVDVRVVGREELGGWAAGWGG